MLAASHPHALAGEGVRFALREADGVRGRLREAGFQRGQDGTRRADELGHAAISVVRHPDVAAGVDSYAVGTAEISAGWREIASESAARSHFGKAAANDVRHPNVAGAIDGHSVRVVEVSAAGLLLS